MIDSGMPRASARLLTLFLSICAGGSLTAGIWIHDGGDGSGPGSETGRGPQRLLPAITVESGPWGAARASTVQRVLQSAAGALWAYASGRDPPPAILVSRSKSGPMTLHERGPRGEIRILLDTGDTYWAQYIFQFAHELGHVLCRHDRDEDANRWFEESICEVASLFVLRRLAEEWETRPPFPHWAPFAPRLAEYAQERLDGFMLPPGVELSHWLRKVEPALRSAADRRDLNGTVAAALLPLLESQPAGWEAVAYLNEEPGSRDWSLAEYLAAWRRRAPARHGAFIDRVASTLGVASRRGYRGAFRRF